DTSSVAVLEAFIARYKDTFFTELARARVDELKKQQIATTTANPTRPNEPSDTGPSWWQRLTASTSSTTSKLEGDEGWIITGAQFADWIIKDRAGKRVFPSEEWAAMRGPGNGRSFQDCANCPEMVVVPAGTFTMGSPANEPKRDSWENQVRV